MEFNFTKDRGVLIVKVQGELDHYSATRLRNAIDDRIYAMAPKGLVLDFSELSMMDSSGIGLIMGRLRLMEEMDRHICVSGAGGSVKKVIMLSGLTKMVALCSTAGEGVNILLNVMEAKI